MWLFLQCHLLNGCKSSVEDDKTIVDIRGAQGKSTITISVCTGVLYVVVKLIIIREVNKVQSPGIRFSLLLMFSRV